MSLRIDARQRAMLAEMGLPVFFPEAVDESEAVSVADSVSDSVAPHATPITPAPLRAPSDGQLEAAPQRRATFSGMGDPHPDWLVVGDASDDEGGLQGEPFTGEAGQLLDNMLRALGVARGRKAYLAHVTKQAQGDPMLRQRVEQLRPKVILAVGRFAVQALLATDEPIGRLRGRAHDYLGMPVVVTYPPVYLLRNQQDKAKSWADLCLAQSLLAPRADV